MARIAEARAPAEPRSEEQRRRYRRMLRAAVALGSEHDFEHVQMHDVARHADVAIATLYRYFPSKHDLFVGVLNAQVVRMQQAITSPGPGQRPGESVAAMLVTAGRFLLRQPVLSRTMLQSNNAAQFSTGRGSLASNAFQDSLLAAGGVETPSEHDLRLVRLIEQTWYGILVSALNGHITPAEAEDDTHLACELLLDDGFALGTGAAVEQEDTA